MPAALAPRADSDLTIPYEGAEHGTARAWGGPYSAIPDPDGSRGVMALTIQRDGRHPAHSDCRPSRDRRCRRCASRRCRAVRRPAIIPTIRQTSSPFTPGTRSFIAQLSGWSSPHTVTDHGRDRTWPLDLTEGRYRLVGCHADGPRLYFWVIRPRELDGDNGEAV
jgi:hypothetical protein